MLSSAGACGFKGKENLQVSEKKKKQLKKAALHA
jgi:hypothetical protein